MAVDKSLRDAQHALAQQRIMDKALIQKTQKEAALPAGPLRISGYLKDIFSTSRTAGAGQHFYSNLQRTRLEGKKELGGRMKADVVVDHEILIGDFFRTPEYDAISRADQRHTSLLDADKIYATRSLVHARASLYRAYVEYDGPAAQVVVGRQTIDWGAFRFYSPMDLFNPIRQTAIERDERIGSDAFNCEFSMKGASKFDVVVAPRRTFSDSSAGVRTRWRKNNYDLSLIIADISRSKVAGFSFDRRDGAGGLRGEFTQTHGYDGRNFPRAALGFDYNFSSNGYLSCEYFYNGGADDTDPALFTGDYVYASRTLSLKRNFINIFVQYQIQPQLKYYNYFIYNLGSSSIFFNPELKYNPITNLDLSVGAQLFSGSAGSEFGNRQNLYYTQAQYLF